MTIDLEAAERELAEAMAGKPDWLLRAASGDPPFYWPKENESVYWRFAATYELARRERERSQHETQATARSTDG